MVINVNFCVLVDRMMQPGSSDYCWVVSYLLDDKIFCLFIPPSSIKRVVMFFCCEFVLIYNYKKTP